MRDDGVHNIRESVMEAARRVDADAGTLGTIMHHYPIPSGPPLVEDRPAEAVGKAVDAVVRDVAFALADAMSGVMRAAQRIGQPVGVVRKIDAEAVTEIHAILCRVQDAPVQAVVPAEAGE